MTIPAHRRRFADHVPFRPVCRQDVGVREHKTSRPLGEDRTRGREKLGEGEAIVEIGIEGNPFLRDGSVPVPTDQR